MKSLHVAGPFVLPLLCLLIGCAFFVATVCHFECNQQSIPIPDNVSHWTRMATIYNAISSRTRCPSHRAVVCHHFADLPVALAVTASALIAARRRAIHSCLSCPCPSDSSSLAAASASLPRRSGMFACMLHGC
ncbi:uncharacterized protein B0H18DRAFT_92731 [Fomitopsis serialis]|uniref:uncharacterized protein n=1 Tax=Fomitopsis serialis TaxID=139415 RepID=UPI002008CEFA|nr:uncharacterized protein B0H18DRAFT_92731 [Neoantrodia serialis]KAH9915652.1 hypothetical protein B0H18DRAFT_92731 [Neoantrodia serialis]